MTEADFLCDFCGSCWSPTRPMVEGHRGSLICARCLSVAYAEVVLASAGTPPDATKVCTLCLAVKSSNHWLGPQSELDARACRECLELSAKMLSRDPESGWTRPEAAR